MKGTKKGIFEILQERDQVLIKEYREKKEHVSASSIKKFAKSPLDFLLYKAFPKESTPSMDEGTLVHMMMLEPELIKKHYWVFDDSKKVDELSKEYSNVRGSKKYKEWKAAVYAKNEDKKPISGQLIDKATLAFKVAMLNPDFRAYVTRLRKENLQNEFMFTKTLHLGYPVKGILDMKSDNDIADLKWMADNSDRALTKQFWNEDLGAYLAQGIYSAAYDFKLKTTMLFMNHNGDVRMREVEDHVLRFAYDKFCEILERFDECVNKHGTFIIGRDFWVQPEYRKITIPNWMVQDED